MKRLIFSYIFFVSFTAFAQNGNVGINTKAPNATLDVNGKMMVRSYPAVDSNAKLLYYPSNGTNVKISPINISDLGYLYTNDFSDKFTINDEVNNNDKNQRFTHGIGSKTFISLTENLSLVAYLQLQIGTSYNLNLDSQLSAISGFNLPRGIYTKTSIALKFTNVVTGISYYPEETITFGEGQNYRLLKNKLLTISFDLPKGNYSVEITSTKLPWNDNTNEVNNNGVILNVPQAIYWQNALQIKIASASIQIIPFTPFYAQ